MSPQLTQDAGGRRETGQEVGPWSVLIRVPVHFGLVEIIEYRAGPGRRITLQLPDHVVEMVLGKSVPDRFAIFDHMPGRHPMGDTTFLVANQRLVVDWPATGPVRAIRCHYNLALTEPMRTFTDGELLAGLAVNSPALIGALNTLATELYLPGFQSSLLAESLTAQIAVELGRFFRRRMAEKSSLLTDAQMMLINQRIEADGALPTADMLAEACRISKRHFFRLFRQTTGMSPSDYAMLRRIERAKRLLREDRMIVKQIAYLCGFQTPSAFSAAFRRTTGMTPREFRSGTGD